MTINQVDPNIAVPGLPQEQPTIPDGEVQVAGIGTAVLKGILKAKGPKPDSVIKKAKPVEREPAVQIKEAEVEAVKVEEAEFSDFKVDSRETHQTNFDLLETTDDVKAEIARVGEANKGAIDEARRGKITNEELRGLSEDLDINEGIVREVMERESGGILNAETLLGARQVLNSSAHRITTLAKQVAKGEATDQEKLQFLRQIQFHREYQTQFMGARAEVGRALNAFSIPTGADDVSLARMRELTDTVHGGNIDRMATMFADAESTFQVGKMSKLTAREKLGAVTYEVFINSILSGIKTHVVNTSGNALFQAMNLAETAVAARMGRFLSGEEHVLVGEAKAHIFGMVSVYRDAMRVAWRGLRTGEGADISKLETKHRKAISSETLEITGPAGRVVDFVGSVIRVPTERLLTAEDEFFKTFARRGKLAQLAYRKAMEKRAAENLTDDQTAQVLQDFIENPPKEAMVAMEDHALYSTFQDPLGERWRTVQKLRNIPTVRYLMPFIKTPANLFKRGLLERSPLAVFTRTFQADIKAGGPRRDMALARVSMGSLTVASVALMVDSGQVTGGGPSDFKARKVLESTGWKPYSVRIEKPDGSVEYQSYARAEPLAYVIGATADMVEIAQYTDYDDEMIDTDERVTRLTAAIVAGVANNTMSKTFMSGISDFTEAMADPKRRFKPWMQRMGGAFIPYSGFRRDLSKIQDPIMRDAWDFKEKLQVSGGIPGWSENSPPRLNVYGQPMYHMKGDLLGVLTPFPNSPQTTDPVKLGVAELMMETKRVPLTLPGRRIEGMKLNNLEYHQMVDLARNELKLGGRTFPQALGKTMNSSLYQNATPDTQITLLKEVQSSFDKAAKFKMYTTDPDYRERLDRHRAKKMRRKVGEALPERLKLLAE